MNDMKDINYIIDATGKEMERLQTAIQKVEEEKARYLKELEDVRSIYAIHIETGKIVDRTKYLADIASVQIKYPTIAAAKINETNAELAKSEKDLEQQSTIYGKYNTQEHGVGAAIDIINDVKNYVNNVDLPTSIKDISTVKVVDNPISFEMPKREEDNQAIEFPANLEQRTESKLSTASFVDDISLSSIANDQNNDKGATVNGLESLFEEGSKDLGESIFEKDNDPLTELRELNAPDFDNSFEKSNLIHFNKATEGMHKVVSVEDANTLSNDEDHGLTLGRKAA